MVLGLSFIGCDLTQRMEGKEENGREVHARNEMNFELTGYEGFSPRLF